MKPIVRVLQDWFTVAVEVTRCATQRESSRISKLFYLHFGWIAPSLRDYSRTTSKVSHALPSIQQIPHSFRVRPTRLGQSGWELWGSSETPLPELVCSEAVKIFDLTRPPGHKKARRVRTIWTSIAMLSNTLLFERIWKDLWWTCDIAPFPPSTFAQVSDGCQAFSSLQDVYAVKSICESLRRLDARIAALR